MGRFRRLPTRRKMRRERVSVTGLFLKATIAGAFLVNGCRFEAVSLKNNHPSHETEQTPGMKTQASLATTSCFDPDLSQVVQGVSVMMCDGTTQVGTMPLGTTLPSCTAEGQSNCIITSPFAATNTTSLAAKLVQGQTAAGVTGTTAIENHSPCAIDGDINCVVAGPLFKAADINTALATNIRSGVTIAGTTGSHGPACSSDGSGSCLVDGTNFVAAQLSNFIAGDIRSGVTIAGVLGTAVIESHSNCLADAGLSCITTASFPAAKATSVLASNIRSGITIAGVTGAYPSVTYRLPGASATTDLVSLAATVTAGAYEFWDSAGVRHTGSIDGPAAITPSTANQTPTTNLSRQFTVNGNANLIATNIRNEVNLFGVTGNFPSATNPLPAGTATADLDMTTFNTSIKSSQSFEWFDSAGNLYTNAGDTNLTAANIGNTVSIFGTTGTFSVTGTSCTSDGQSSCLTTSQFRAVNPNNFTGWDLRMGKTIYAKPGELFFNRDLVQVATFDRQSGDGALTGADPYDTLDDGGASIPTETPTGWYQPTGSNWVRDAASDNGAGGGVASNGLCDGTEECVYLDRITGIYVAKPPASTRFWEANITYCEGLTYGTYTDWHVPTQKALAQLNINGLADLASAAKFNVANTYYWTATTNSQSASTSAWYVYSGTGFVSNQIKGSSPIYTICTR